MDAQPGILDPGGYLRNPPESPWTMGPRPALAPLVAELLVRSVGLGLAGAAVILGAILLA